MAEHNLDLKKDQRKKVEKVVTGKVRSKKKSEVAKFKDIFIAEDAANVKSYVFMDVLVPAVKKAISDIVRDGIDMILYGSTSGKKRSGVSDRVSYRSYYDRDNRRDEPRSRSRSRYSFDRDFILDSRGEAEEVLTHMDELIDMYGMVTVADLCDLVGESSAYTDNKYGWTNIRNAKATRERGGGYILELPRAIPID
jgi:hypothetical protein